MDIAKLKSRQIELPYIGKARPKFNTIGFYLWFENKEFDTGEAFLKEAIEEQFELENDTARDIVLNDHELNEIADALLTDIAQDERYSEDLVELRADTKPCERLLQIHLTQMERSREIVGRTMKPIGQSIGRLVGTTNIFDTPPYLGATRRMFDDMTRLTRVIEPSAGIRAILESHRSAASEIRDLVNVVGSTPSWQALETANAVGSLQSSIAGLDFGASRRFSETLSKSIIGDLRLAQTSLRGLQPQLGQVGRFSDNYLNENLRLTGFLSTAEVGLSGLAAKSAAAEVLARYHDDDLPETSALAVSLEAVSSLDVFDEDAELSGTDIEEILTKSLAAVVFVIGTEQSVISRQNVLQLAAIILAVIGIYLATQGATKENQQTLIEQNERIIRLQQDDLSQNEALYKSYRRLSAAYHLREEPDVESQSITILNTDQIVIVSRIKGDWAYIEVLPYADEPPLSGWIHRNGLRPL